MTSPFPAACTITLGYGAIRRSAESRRWKDQKRNDEGLVRRTER